ncbi:hypothetical protein Acid345_4286 [Candidatus Koribacter versatilis Ellin345]|uniref:Uncharacterized protein n=1 Tax=Koribacter versatilis (strain Ellin345) TaxID=204669 RepID=Q1IIL4_KORVE|nr:hypothetical protein [Candidatus Koribacter versatilis]ABF43286.1 hypothetical protein Acid345_4286 [Candidatus Koribacter versatilis Ellin345]
MKLRLLVVLCVLTSIMSAQNFPMEAKVSSLQFHTARTSDDALATALEIMFRNRAVCCSKESSLVDVVARANPANLQDVATKLQGRHVLGDGRPIQVSATFYPTTPTNGSLPASSYILSTLLSDHPLLMQWKGKLYVVHGANYTQQVINSDSVRSALDIIDTLFLFEPVTGEQTTFNRVSDNWNEVQGVLAVSATWSSS